MTPVTQSEINKAACWKTIETQIVRQPKDVFEELLTTAAFFAASATIWHHTAADRFRNPAGQTF